MNTSVLPTDTQDVWRAVSLARHGGAHAGLAVWTWDANPAIGECGPRGSSIARARFQAWTHYAAGIATANLLAIAV